MAKAMVGIGARYGAAVEDIEQPVVALAYFGMVVHQAATTPLRSARRRQIHMLLTP